MVEWSELLSGLVGSLVGGGLAILGTVWGAHLQHEAQAKLVAEAATAEVAGYLGALHAELTVLSNSFRTRVQPALDAVPDGEVFRFKWPARYDYFTVYNANAQLLGRIPDPDLRTMIVTAYTAAKGILDSLGYNGEAVQALADLQGGAPFAAREAQIAASTADLVEYARGLRASAAELEGLIDAVLPQLQALSAAA
jgi:hypothetical protein